MMSQQVSPHVQIILPNQLRALSTSSFIGKHLTILWGSSLVFGNLATVMPHMSERIAYQRGWEAERLLKTMKSYWVLRNLEIEVQQELMGPQAQRNSDFFTVNER